MRHDQSIALQSEELSATENGVNTSSNDYSEGPSSIENTDKTTAETTVEVVRAPRTLKPIAWICLIISILSSDFLFAIDNTIVADVQPQIIFTLGDIQKLPWISVAFALGGVGSNLFWSKLYGNFDNKLLFISSFIIFEVGSAVCGASPTLNALIVGRAICGVGGLGLYLGTVNMLAVLTTDAERPMYMSFIGLIWGVGTVLGPIIGGACAGSSATWRWAFYINLCVGAVAAPAYIFILPSSNPRPNSSTVSKIRELDFLGAVLIAGALVSLVMAISFGGGEFAWNSGQVIGLFVCTVVLWILFICQQGFCIFTTREFRVFPVEFIKSWEMNILAAGMMFAQIIVFVPIYFVPLYFQFVRGDDALEAGVRLLPFVFVFVFAVIFNGVVMSKLGYYMPWYLLGGILSVIGGSLLHTVTAQSSTSRMYGYSIFPAIGGGFFCQASLSIAQVKVQPSRVPRAVAFIGCAQIFGVTLGLAISNSIFLNRATDKIAAILPSVPRSQVQQAISGGGSAFFETLSSETKLQVLDAIVQSIGSVYILVLTSGACVILLSLFMKRERLFIEPAVKNNPEVDEKLDDKKQAGLP